MAPKSTHLEDLIEDVLAARYNIRQSEVALDRAVREAWPAGRSIRWRKGHHEQEGVVVRHCGGGRMLVNNSKTGRNVFITEADTCEIRRRERQ